MDTQRLVLFFAFSFTLLLLWQAWQSDYGPQPVAPPTEQTGAATAPDLNTEPPAVAAEGAGDVPTAPIAPGSAEALAVQAGSEATGSKVRVVTDTLVVEIDTRGGTITRLALPTYPVSLDDDTPFPLLGQDEHLFHIAQSGLIGEAGRAPDHHALYQAAQVEYRLADGQEELRVPLTWSSADGVIVTKSFVFHRGSNTITLEHRVDNGSGEPWRGREYRQLQRTKPDSSATSQFMYTYTGGAIYSRQEKYEKVKFEEMEDKPLSRDIEGGWAAMLQHYFITAWIPDQGQTNHFYSKVHQGSRYVLGLWSPEQQVAPGAGATFTSTLYAGPKLQEVMAQVAEGLELTVDYGILTFLAQPIFWLMTHIHALVQNWGWTIILLTLLIKAALYKLSETSYRSMGEMRKLQPRMQKLKEQYGDDKQRLNEKLMQIYKEEKINPVGGCLPIVLQIPVFIALYWVLLESVEMRQAPWIFWIQDLATKDPYYVLPLLMGITMFAQQKLNPQPLDPIQAKVMMALPVVFTFFFAFFPSGLVLYWVINSIASIAQQWVITKRIEAGK